MVSKNTKSSPHQEQKCRPMKLTVITGNVNEFKKKTSANLPVRRPEANRVKRKRSRCRNASTCKFLTRNIICCEFMIMVSIVEYLRGRGWGQELDFIHTLTKTKTLRDYPAVKKACRKDISAKSG